MCVQTGVQMFPKFQKLKNFLIMINGYSEKWMNKLTNLKQIISNIMKIIIN